MNKTEAAEVAEARLSELRNLSYGELVEAWLDQPRSEYERARSGTPYNLEIEAVWDGRPREALRVWVIVDEGGRSATFPLQRDFIIAPDGTFIGE